MRLVKTEYLSDCLIDWFDVCPRFILVVFYNNDDDDVDDDDDDNEHIIDCEVIILCNTFYLLW